jgi:multidrug resistance efflux pump
MADSDPLIPAATASQPVHALAALVQFEAELRRKASVPELLYYVANDSRRVLDHDQLFVLGAHVFGERMKVLAASGVVTVDAQAPLIDAIERMVVAKRQADGSDGPISWLLDEDVAGADVSDALADYPFRAMQWQPLKGSDGLAFGGLLVARARSVPEESAARLTHVAESVAHSWRALTGDRPVRRLRRIGRRERIGLLVLIAAIALFPTRMSVLAPAEVVAERPFVIAAPYDGVVARIDVAPHSRVRAGQRLMALEDVEVRNAFLQAQQRLEVARARFEQASSAAFADRESAASLETLRAEFEVAEAEYRLTSEQAQRSQIVAPRAGTIIYTDRRDWEGRAVSVGEPIMQLVNPAQAVVRVDMPTGEQMSLMPGADARIWLDAQPLWAVDGRVEQASFQARETADGVMAFAIIVRPNGAPLRIGSRGTAKLYGGWVPFIYAVLRRPIAGLRQSIGV